MLVAGVVGALCGAATTLIVHRILTESATAASTSTNVIPEKGFENVELAAEINRSEPRYPMLYCIVLYFNRIDSETIYLSAMSQTTRGKWHTRDSYE